MYYISNQALIINTLCQTIILSPAKSFSIDSEKRALPMMIGKRLAKLKMQLCSKIEYACKLLICIVPSTLTLHSITFQVLKILSEASRLAILCYFIDTFEVALEVTKIKGHKQDVSTLIANLMYTTWAWLKARTYKRSFFKTVVDNAPTKRKRKQDMVEILDKVIYFPCDVLSQCRVLCQQNSNNYYETLIIRYRTFFSSECWH